MKHILEAAAFPQLFSHYLCCVLSIRKSALVPNSPTVATFQANEKYILTGLDWFTEHYWKWVLSGRLQAGACVAALWIHSRCVCVWMRSRRTYQQSNKPNTWLCTSVLTLGLTWNTCKMTSDLAHTQLSISFSWHQHLGAVFHFPLFHPRGYPFLCLCVCIDMCRLCVCACVCVCLLGP